MMLHFWRLLALAYISTLSITEGSQSDSIPSLRDRLKYYEVLNGADLVGFTTGSDGHRRQKRGILAHQPNNPTTELKIRTLGRDFHLYVYPRREVFAPGFEAHVVEENGSMREVIIDADAVYSGHVEGGRTSSVSLFWEAEGVLNAKIVTEDDSYFIEPSRRFLDASENHTMISYRGSDIIASGEKDQVGPKTCAGVKHAERESQYNQPDSDEDWMHINASIEEERGGRQKRFTPTKNVCPLLLVCDYRFFRDVALSNEHNAANYMLGLISRVNTIYTTTTFTYGNDQIMDNMGFQVKMILIQGSQCSAGEGSTCSSAKYNCIQDDCTPQQVLNAFGLVGASGEDYRSYCLAHLFTSYQFSNGVLGLAYIASPSLSTLGGICSSYHRGGDGQRRYLNTGWSSAINRGGSKILTQEAELVLAHELGHNWGSEHDPTDCAPGGADGNYIMYQYAVSGFDTNNRIFSPCTRRFIGTAISQKSYKCFTERVDSLAGNYQVDADGEECDAGPTGDACCTSEFKLHPSAVCSDRNSACCHDCQLTTQESNTKCQDALPSKCQEDSYCSGRETTCPITRSAVGSKCVLEGRCVRNSETSEVDCLSLCSIIGRERCACSSNEDDGCLLCCKDISGNCVPINEPLYNKWISLVNSTNPIVQQTFAGRDGGINLPANTPCAQGLCDQGKCSYVATGVIERFWKFLTELTPSGFVQFMRDNMVGTIIVLSIVLWMPIHIFIYCKDKKYYEELEKEEEAIQKPALFVPPPNSTSREALISMGYLSYSLPTVPAEKHLFPWDNKRGFGAVGV